MKINQHFHLYSRLMVVAVLAMMVFVLQRSVDTRAEITPRYAEIDGWAWSPTAGWLSLNCLNDFNGDKILENTCLVSNYKLSLTNHLPAEGGPMYIAGCAWGGSSVGPTVEPLGWVCFSNPGGTLALPNGVPTSTAYINALENDINSGYASIRKLEYLEASYPDWDAYKLGFPILGIDMEDTITADDPIKGCVNCYTEKIYSCEITGVFCDCPGGEVSCSGGCAQAGDPLADQLCVLDSVQNKCDNCLHYQYYQGRCAANHAVSCLINSDCSSGDTCEPISTCSEDITINCTDDPNICDDPANCLSRPINSLKRTTGGYQCSACTIGSFDNDIQINAYGWNANSCNACTNAFYTPGVIFDNKNGYIGTQAQHDACTEYGGLGIGDDMQAGDFCERVHLGGWAWNAWNTGPPDNLEMGLGWVQFSPRITTTTNPYFSVESGSIYSRGSIFSRYGPPPGKYNASYLIESGGTITNFYSSSSAHTADQWELANRPWTIDFLNPLGTHYANALGSLDYLGLITTFDASVPQSPKNKFGSKISKFDPEDVTETEDFINSFNESLAGKVFYASTTGQASTVLDINTALIIRRGDSLSRGSGIVIVDGDLNINADITYETGQVDNLSHIPSLVWVVRGDVTIANDVDYVAGTFVVLGDGTEGSGQFISGDSALPSINNQLTIYGNVLARRFDLQRTFYNADLVPAELFVNDGRLQANPPPGLTDFSRAMPRFSETW